MNCLLVYLAVLIWTIFWNCGQLCFGFGGDTDLTMASNYGVFSNGGRFNVLSEGYELDASDITDFCDLTGKRKRRNSSGTAFTSVSFDKKSIDAKLSLIFDELQSIKLGQDGTQKMVAATYEATKLACTRLNQVAMVTNKQSELLKTMAYKQIDLEARSRRNNLVVWGVVERQNENCFQVVRQLIESNLGLEADNMYLARAHRLGPWRNDVRANKRPIIVNFRDYCDLELVLSKAFMLKNTQYSLDRDLPKEISEARKRLWPTFKSMKSDNPRAKVKILYPAKLVCDKTVIQDEFPDWYSVLARSRISALPCIDITPQSEPLVADLAHVSEALSRGSFMNDSEKGSLQFPTRDNISARPHDNNTTVNSSSLSGPSSQPDDMLLMDFEVQLQNINEAQTSADLGLGKTTESNSVTEHEPSLDKGASIKQPSKHSLFKPYDSKLAVPSQSKSSTSLNLDSKQVIKESTVTEHGHVSRSPTRNAESHRRTQSDVRQNRDRVSSRDRRFQQFSANRQLCQTNEPDHMGDPTPTQTATGDTQS